MKDGETINKMLGRMHILLNELEVLGQILSKIIAP